MLTLSLKCSVGQSTRKHAVDQDADPIGDPLDVGQDVRAEEDRPPLRANQMDHRHQEIAAGDRIEAQRRVVENEQIGIGGDRQGQRDVGPLAVRQPAELRPQRDLEMLENLVEQSLIPALADEMRGRTAAASPTVIQP